MPIGERNEKSVLENHSGLLVEKWNKAAVVKKGIQVRVNATSNNRRGLKF